MTHRRAFDHSTYDVPRREVSDRVLGGQRGRTKHDEDEDEVGEDVVVNQLVAGHTNSSGGRKTQIMF